MIFENFILALDVWGVTDVLLPFILIFTIVFATLQKSRILGEGKKQFNVMVALVMSLAVVIPHVTGGYPFNFDPVLVINQALPQVSIVLVAIIMLLLIVGVFGNEVDIAGTSLSFWVIILALIAVIGIFGSALGWFSLPGWLNFLYDSELQALIVMILVFGIIIAFITKEDREDKKKTGLGTLMDDVKRAVKKK